MGRLEDEMSEMLEQERAAGHVSGGNPDPINRPMEPGEFLGCGLGPHLPGWPLVVYTGHETHLHGVAVVRKAGIRWSRRKEAYVFELTLEFDAATETGRKDTVTLEHVALGHVQPITPRPVNS
jgi:hypothetical protein